MRGKPNTDTQVTTLYTKSQPRKAYYKFSTIATVNFYEVAKMADVTLHKDGILLKHNKSIVKLYSLSNAKILDSNLLSKMSLDNFIIIT